MAICPDCSEELDSGVLYLDAKGAAVSDPHRAHWKSCPRCSELAGVHVLLRFDESFGWRSQRGQSFPQSDCTFHRNRAHWADDNPTAERRTCTGAQLGARRRAARSPGLPPEPPEPTPSLDQLNALLTVFVGPMALEEEGRKRLHAHILVERSRKNRGAILALRQARGPLACEACNEVIADAYGPEHAEVVDVHHLRPLAQGVQNPSPSDFAILCPTCHRVVHFRREEPMDLEELRRKLGTRRTGAKERRK